MTSAGAALYATGVHPKPTKRALLAQRMVARRAGAAQAHWLLHCEFCDALVQVCVPCHRGQRYCSSGCRQQARRSQLRVAGQRYQRTESGRHHHAARQRAYATRRKAQRQASAREPLQGEPVTPSQAPQQASLPAPHLGEAASRTAMCPLPKSAVERCLRCGRSSEGWFRRYNEICFRRRRRARGP